MSVQKRLPTFAERRQRLAVCPAGVNRRAALLAAAALACSGFRRRAWAGPDPPAASRAGPYIDIHTHLGQTWNNSKPLTAAGLLNWMDEHDVAQAVVLPLVSPESSSYLLTSDFVLEATRGHRDRLIPFCCVDPRTSYHGGQRGLVEMLRKYVDQGAKGFGEHKPGLPIDDSRSRKLYAACGELKLPVLFHLDNERNLDAPGLPGLERVLQDHKETTFIGHGPGWWASIAGGVRTDDLGKYPAGTIAAGGAIDALMDKHPNLYGDLSAGSGAGALQRDPAFARAFVIRRAEQLLFGTDFLSPGQEVLQFRAWQQLELPADVNALVLRENAKKLLGL